MTEQLSLMLAVLAGVATPGVLFAVARHFYRRSIARRSIASLCARIRARLLYSSSGASHG